MPLPSRRPTRVRRIETDASQDTAYPTDRDVPAAPPQVPIAEAARAPIGPDRPSAWRRTLDLLAVVVAPIVVPAVVLAATRATEEKGLMASFTLTDVAFGVVAVAFAALTRAITGRGEGWLVVAGTGILAIVFETAMAVRSDTVMATELLTGKISDCHIKCNSLDFSSLLAQIHSASPSSIQWSVVILTGVTMCLVTIVAIVSEP